LSLLAGIWIIYRGNRRELHSINNQNNFLLAITHELKSPLASVKLILNTLKSRRLEDDQKNHLLNTAQTEINRLDDMIHNLLLSPDSQSFSISSELIQIEELILELLNSEHFKNSEIELNVCRDSSHLMKADKKYLPIAIKNVLENAIKYGSDEPIILNINATNNQTEIEIKDSGPGIPQEEKAHIFKRFYRLGNEWTRSTKGTGLGLYISKKIIDAHNGRIEVLNNYPTGAIFKIILPSNAS
jgi:K+-sensing histidine kinase KdpD